MRCLNVIILGQGRSGRDIHGFHLKKDTERFKVVGVVEPMKIRRERAAAEYGCEVYNNYKEILDLKGIDLVVNSTPSHLHFKITKDLLEHGFNVLCEKPFTPTLKQFDILVKTAEENNVTLMVFQQSRFAAYFEKVKEIIKSGVIGRPVEISINFNSFARRWDWQCLQSRNGGNLANTGPHPLDQALNLLDSYDVMPKIFCSMDRCNTYGDAEDFIKLILSVPGRPLIDLEISSADAYPLYTYKVQGTRGSLKGNMAHIDWKYFLPHEAPKQQLVKGTLTQGKEKFPAYCSETLIWHEESWDGDPAAPFIAAVAKYYDTIYEHITEGKPLVVTMNQVRQQIAIIETVHKQYKHLV